jgi:hypothetical protein
MRAHDIICLHTMAGGFAGVNIMFHENGYSGTESHFGIAGSGAARQWQDLDFQADANWDGNDHVISIETADKGENFPSWTGSNVPPWTPQQLDRIVRICDWLCTRYDIPRRLIPNTRPGHRGIAYHRQGCPGNFEQPYTGIVPGGELWTNPTKGFGKVCPGDRRIRQIETIIIPRLQKPFQLPTYLLEDDSMTLIRKRSNDHTLIFAAGKLIAVTGPKNWSEAEKGGVPTVILDDDEYDRIVRHFGPALT